MKMKNIITSFILSFLLLLSSCTTTLVSTKKQNSIDSVIKKDKTYIFIKNDGTKEKFRVIDIDENKISGKNTDEKSLAIDRNQISEIKKSNTLGTVLIVAGVVAGILVIPSYAQNKPVGQ